MFFSKNKEYSILNKSYIYSPLYQHIENYKSEGKSWKYTSIITKLDGKKVLKETESYTYYTYDNFQSESISQFAKNNNLTEEEVFNNFSDKIFRTTNAQSSVRKKVMTETKDVNNTIIGFEYFPIKGKNKGNKIEILYKDSNRNMLMFLSDVVEFVNKKPYYLENTTTLWDDIQYNNLSREGKTLFENGKKPELLIKRIIELTTDQNDIVLDFFMGSGTTQAVAMKMNRQFIGVEQMEYINTVSVSRLQKVIDGEQGGISKDVDWQGGGSFVYAELDSLNQQYIDRLNEINSEVELEAILEEMKSSAYLNFKVELHKVTVDDENFSTFSLDKKKKVLIDVLDMNQLYLNYSEIDDTQYNISEEVKQFNHSFYNQGGE
jgi:adenine-specific DNA-methyltransferase